MPSIRVAHNRRSGVEPPWRVGVRLAIAIAAVTSCGRQARPSVASPSAQTSVSSAPSRSGADASSSPDEATDTTQSSNEPEPDVVDSPAAPNRSGVYDCGSKRPTVCEATASPVCARRQASSAAAPGEQGVTYVNGCLACADPAIADYVRGRCVSSASGPTPSQQHEANQSSNRPTSHR